MKLYACDRCEESMPSPSAEIDRQNSTKLIHLCAKCDLQLAVFLGDRSDPTFAALQAKEKASKS